MGDFSTRNNLECSTFLNPGIERDFTRIGDYRLRFSTPNSGMPQQKQRFEVPVMNK